MTRAEAIELTLQIVSECKSHVSKSGGGCRECPFGFEHKCLISGGSDFPSTWFINKLTDKESEE